MADNRLIPDSIRDVNTEALNALIDRFGIIDLTPLLIYIIDNVSVSALPHLAEQFHVAGNEGWRLAQDEAEQRTLIKAAIPAHQYKGTKYGLVKVLESLGLAIKVSEWFEYAGPPYNFKIQIDINNRGMDQNLTDQLYALVEEYKNVRSRFDLVLYLANHCQLIQAIGLVCGENITVWPWQTTTLVQNGLRTYAIGSYHYEVVTINPLPI